MSGLVPGGSLPSFTIRGVRKLWFRFFASGSKVRSLRFHSSGFRAAEFERGAGLVSARDWSERLEEEMVIPLLELKVALGKLRVER